MIISAMSDSTSKRRQEERKSGEQKSFEQLLAAEAKRQEKAYSMAGKTIGYTRNGQVYIGEALQRSYN